MVRQATNPLALVPSEPLPLQNQALMIFDPGRSLTRDEKRVQVERDLELAVIASVQHVGAAAIPIVSDFYIFAYCEFERASGDILAIKDRSHGAEHQLYLDAYAKQLIPRLAHHTTGLVEVIAHSIAQELHRPKHPEPEPPSLLARIFGRRG